MSFQQGLSGLNAAARNLEVIGNNVANAGTIGFKQARAQFADVYANAAGSGAISTVGIGTTMVKATQQFSQGNLTSTSNPLDMAINGNGFFRVSLNGTVGYTRNGQFEVDKNGYITTMSGARLTGYQADAMGNVAAGTASDLKISNADLTPKATTSATIGMNLDSRALKPTAPFDPTKPTTYQGASTMATYDSLGNQHSIGLYFVKNAANTWDVYAQVDGNTTPGAALGQLTFNTDGTFKSSTVGALAITAPGANPMSVALDFAGATQFGSTTAVTSIEQDGYTSGKLTGFAVGPDGKIQGQYSNGKTLVLGQVALASFNNAQGLMPMGGNLFAETSASGGVLMGPPSSGSFGVLQGGTLEESTVDLTAELVHMITAQREYQANAQSIKTEDQLMQTLMSLR